MCALEPDRYWLGLEWIELNSVELDWIRLAWPEGWIGLALTLALQIKFFSE